jgi:hypothetical protein
MFNSDGAHATAGHLGETRQRTRRGSPHPDVPPIGSWDEPQDYEGKASPAQTLLFIMVAIIGSWALILLPMFLLLR